MITKIFHKLLDRNMDMYVDKMVIKFKRGSNHLADIEEVFNILRAYHMKLNPIKCTFRIPESKFLGYIIYQREIEANSEKIQAIMKIKPLKILKQV